MKTPEVKMLWITDPWSTLDHSQDTTLRLMHEAINMGISTYWSASDQLFSSTTTGSILAVELKKSNSPLDLSNVVLTPFPLSSFQQIHNRIDPPVDENYRHLIDTLISRGAKEFQILNPPQLLKNQSEKIPPSDLQQYIPRLKVVQNAEDVFELEKLFSKDAEVISKPLHLAQSIGVRKHPTPQNQQEWTTLIENLTLHFTQEILFEEYLPQIDQGEVRMWFTGKHFIAALKKYPKTGDFRVLIDEGSRVAAHTLTIEEQKIATAIGLSLEKQGILLAAIDLIGNKICDYNITSPGLLVQLEKVHGGKNFAKDVLKELLNRALEYPVMTDHE
jgi:glutathione synthase